MNKPDIRSMSLDELTQWMVEIGEKPFRARQLFSWLHQKQASSFGQMTDLSESFRDRLSRETTLVVLEAAAHLCSQIDGTEKFLFRLMDGNVIESVLMRYRYGNSVCISTQAGCRMGCRFCASTLDGLVRNLTSSEMVEQIYRIQEISGERVSHIVLMGSGEPLDNYDHVLRFLELISSEKGMGLSPRNITLSTCGLVPEIYRLAKEKLQITLAISLHGADDETRKKLMPIAKKYSIMQLMEACDFYFKETGRRISFEYSLVKGVNDTEAEARKLSALLKGKNCHVNLIPVNPIKERNYRQSLRETIEHFKNVLEKNGIHATIRREMGRDIQGACGQLRRSYEQSGSGGEA